MKRALIAFVATLGLTACGQIKEDTKKVETPAAIPAASNGQKPQATLPGTNPGADGSPNAQSTIANYPFFGTYSGTILRYTSVDGKMGVQNYTLVIGKTPVPGSSDIYVTASLGTSGASGTINKATYLGVIAGTGIGSYVFVSQPISTDWSNRNQVLEIYLSFNGTALVAGTQSRVYMRECGFSDSTLCMNPSSDIGFGLDLIKQ